VVSKNEHAAAVLPFREHPHMVLKEEDISVFVANWDNKVDNIRLVQKTLNIGLDSLVFLDDNPFERNIVRQFLPDVVAPDLSWAGEGKRVDKPNLGILSSEHRTIAC
jgi:FkbH-like protein